MACEAITIPMKEGAADGYLALPDGWAGGPSVLLYMDVLGLRPLLVEMAERLARYGYAVLLPNLLWREGKAPVFPPDALAKPENRERLFAFVASLTPERTLEDAADYVAFLNGISGSDAAIGIVGYCMSGMTAMLTATAFPARVAACAIFHGSRMASDAPESPHLALRPMAAEFYFGLAETDPLMPPDQVERLVGALTANGIAHDVETYPGTTHGFALRPAENEAAVAAHWAALLALFERRLRRVAA